MIDKFIYDIYDSDEESDIYTDSDFEEITESYSNARPTAPAESVPVVELNDYSDDEEVSYVENEDERSAQKNGIVLILTPIAEMGARVGTSDPSTLAPDVLRYPLGRGIQPVNWRANKWKTVAPNPNPNPPQRQSDGLCPTFRDFCLNHRLGDSGWTPRAGTTRQDSTNAVKSNPQTIDRIRSELRGNRAGRGLLARHLVYGELRPNRDRSPGFRNNSQMKTEELDQYFDVIEPEMPDRL